MSILGYRSANNNSTALQAGQERSGQNKIDADRFSTSIMVAEEVKSNAADDVVALLPREE
ncbi:MAG: hypothetical protein HZA63_14950 [Rhodocyclales bacterium]|nr:hypothetical protein [Rhodocyclales bacterium]